MTELKTLKDIQIIGPDGVEDSEYVKRLLRAEAVKWIKLKDEMIKAKKGIEDINQIETELIFAIPWIKHFFNLTEEDLIGSVNNERRKNEN